MDLASRIYGKPGDQPAGRRKRNAEEVNAEVENMQLFCVFSIAHISQVYTKKGL